MGRVEEWNVLLEDFFDRMFFCAVIAFEEDEAERERFEEIAGVNMSRAFDEKEMLFREKKFEKKAQGYMKNSDVTQSLDIWDMVEREYAMESGIRQKVYGAEMVMDEGSVARDEWENPVESMIQNRFFKEEDELAESFLSDVEFGKSIGKYDIETAETTRGIKLNKDRVERILQGEGEVRESQTGDVTIRMINNKSEAHEIDIDETMELIGERLYELMNRSADGLYW